MRVPNIPKNPTCFIYAAGALALLPSRSARAETSVAYKYQDYSETDGRVQVHAQYGSIEQSLGTDAKLKVMGVLDAISGATPTGQLVDPATGELPLTEIHDHRKAWTAEYSQQIDRVHVALGASNSRESDYVSTGLSLNTITDLNGKNTGLVLGVAGTHDKARVFFQDDWAKKDSQDFIVGLNQLIDPETTLSVNLGYGHASGYLSDPYKIIQKHTNIIGDLYLDLTFPENRPGKRDKYTFETSVNHAFKPLKAAVEGSYRYYTDSFGIHSHTLEATWFQKLGSKFILAPTLRFYQQGAADFYHLSLDGTSIVPTEVPNSQGPFYSSDHRLSKMRTFTAGLKLSYQPTEAFRIDLAYDRYDMRGLDGKTPSQAFSKANLITAGISYTF